MKLQRKSISVGYNELTPNQFGKLLRDISAISYVFDAKLSTEAQDQKEKLRASFPLTAPYSTDPLEFAKNYIREMRKWAEENLGVAKY